MKKVSLMALMLVAGANVNAANMMMDNMMSTKYYVGGKLGYTSLQTIQYVDDKAVDNTDKKANAFDYSVNAGVKADDMRFELELGTMTFGEYEKETTKGKMTSLMSNAYYDVDLQKLAGVMTPVKPYVSAGLGFTHTDAQVWNAVDEEYKNAPANRNEYATWQVGAGVSYEVMPMVTLDAGYKYQRLFANDTNDGKNFQKDTKHSVVFGARYGF